MRPWVAAWLVMAACTDTTGGGQAPSALDAETYAVVQPYVGPTCGTLDCHGVPGQPLRLYAEHGLRLTTELRGEPITAEELARNVAAFAGIDPGRTPDEHLAYLKPLAESAGGMAHEGGDLWPAVDDDGALCVHGWLAGQSAAELTPVCEGALQALDLPESKRHPRAR